MKPRAGLLPVVAAVAALALAGCGDDAADSSASSSAPPASTAAATTLPGALSSVATTAPVSVSATDGAPGTTATSGAGAPGSTPTSTGGAPAPTTVAGGAGATTTSTTAEQPGSPDGSLPPAPSTTNVTTPATGSCVKGWDRPPAGSIDERHPLDIVQDMTGYGNDLTAVDVRRFLGPDAAVPTASTTDVIWWYVKLTAPSDPTFSGRFLIREASGRVPTVFAAAAATTTGFTSPDWSAFTGTGTPAPYPNLPGQWVGTRYDPVTGAGGPALPTAVAGCLAGT